MIESGIQSVQPLCLSGGVFVQQSHLGLWEINPEGAEAIWRRTEAFRRKAATG